MFFFLSKLEKADTSMVQNVVGKERIIIGNILNVVRIIGTGMAVIMLTWMSFSYFTANGRGHPGAVEKAADIKGKQLQAFAIGVFIFAASSNIIYLIANFITDVVSGT